MPIISPVSSPTQLIRFVMAGGLATAIHVIVLISFTEWFHVWYGVATTVGFLAGFLISFTLQKYWTFQEWSTTHLPRQAGLFFAMQAGNLCVNTVLLIVLVEVFRMHYLFGQFVVLGCIAVLSFVLSKMIFNKPTLNCVTHISDH